MISSLRNCNWDYEKYEQNFIKVLNTHAPKNIKILRGNHKPRYNKNLRKGIMKGSRLKDKANRSKDPVDIAYYKKQRTLVVSLNSQGKSEYFNEISNTKSSRPFGKLARHTFQINMLAEILRVCSFKMTKCY